jgi:hypothetical protein
MLGPTLSACSEEAVEALRDFPDMKYATPTIINTSATAIATLNFNDPMNEAPLLLFNCISKVSKDNVEWSGRGAGFVSALLRGCGCSGLAAGTRIDSRVDGDFAAATGACVVGDFAAAAGACVTGDFAAAAGVCVTGDFAAAPGACVAGDFAAAAGVCVTGDFAAGTWTAAIAAGSTTFTGGPFFGDGEGDAGLCC